MLYRFSLSLRLSQDKMLKKEKPRLKPKIYLFHAQSFQSAFPQEEITPGTVRHERVP